MLALLVILSSFVIFGAFLWVGATYLVPAEGSPVEPAAAPSEAPPRLSIPCESDGNRVFVRPEDVAFVRADGHYTQVYTDHDRYFCVWPITEASKRLVSAGFLKSHRSYLINPDKVARFERGKDKGRCTFRAAGLPPAPVSRSHVKTVQALLAGQDGAVHAS